MWGTHKSREKKLFISSDLLAHDCKFNQKLFTLAKNLSISEKYVPVIFFFRKVMAEFNFNACRISMLENKDTADSLITDRT